MQQNMTSYMVSGLDFEEPYQLRVRAITSKSTCQESDVAIQTYQTDPCSQRSFDLSRDSVICEGDTIPVNESSTTASYDFYLNNAFSPNDDGLNDRFHVTASEGVSVKSFKVFTRWGEAVYRSKNAEASNQGWDGTYRGEKRSQGRYLYLIEVEIGEQERRQFFETGSLMLVR